MLTQDEKLNRAIKALTDIAEGNYPGSLQTLMEQGLLEARTEMWLWSQKCARETLETLK
jgi:hypothetical protein